MQVPDEYCVSRNITTLHKLHILVGTLDNEMRDTLKKGDIFGSDGLPPINCESVKKLLNKCAQALELAKLNYEYICKPAANVEPGCSTCETENSVHLSSLGISAEKKSLLSIYDPELLDILENDKTAKLGKFSDKADVAVRPCARCDGVVVEVNEINATALKFAIDFSQNETSTSILSIAQKFKDFLEK